MTANLIQMRNLLVFVFASATLFAQQASDGFHQIFNGKDLKGWHVSEVNSHGNSKGWTVKDGVLMGTQQPLGNGGILLTDKNYKDFEITLEANPDWGCDGGLFLRSNERGQAYQVMIDYLEGGTVGGIYGEGLQGIGRGTGTGDNSGKDWQKYWKKGDWNRIRARMEGDVPHVQVWLNGTQIVDWTDSANHAADGATGGMIALQVHRNDPKWKSQRWIEGGYHRFRNIEIKELN